MSKSGKIRVTNHRLSPRVLYDANGRGVVVPPNGSAVLFVSERQERDLSKSKYMSVESVADGDIDDVPQPPKQMNAPEAPQEEVVLGYQQLIDAAGDMTYAEFLRNAKVTLGDDFPTGRAGGQPKKAELMRVLRRLVKE